MAPWVVRFVDKPDVGRVTRLDLNTEESGGNVYVRPEGFSLGVGEKEVAVSESMLTEGETVTAWKRSNRELSIPLAVEGGSVEVSAVLNAIARELDRPTNYLEFKPSDHTGESVFFTLVPGSDFGEVDIDPEEYPGERWVHVTLTCEPVAVGLPVTGFIDNMSNDPASHQAALPTIKGDVAAPLNIELAALTGTGILGNTTLVNVHTGATLRAVRLNGEAASLGADTTLPGNDPAMHGTGSNYARSSFATNNTMVGRVFWSGVTLTFGTYKVLARVRKTNAAGVFDLRYLHSPSSVYGKTIRYGVTSDVGPHWLDLGPWTVPVGHIPPGVTQDNIGSLYIEAMRVSGTGSLDFDCIKLLPVEAASEPPFTTATVWHDTGDNTLVLGLNADDDEVWTRWPGSTVGVKPLRRGGALPMVHPGYTNWLTVMRSVGLVPDRNGGTKPDGISWTTDVTWSYRPRYLYLSAPA